MSRLATNRVTPLTPSEIAETALRQFDSRSVEPSIRSLAAELKVAPTAIYHHFPSQAAVFQAAVDLVWDEATADVVEVLTQSPDASAQDILLAIALATRRAWLAHPRLARHMAATPQAGPFVTRTLTLMTELFEAMGLDGDDAAAAFHMYCSFMIGAVLFAAERIRANHDLAIANGELGPRYRGTPDAEGTRAALDVAMNLSVVDPARDEELFELGVRRLVLAITGTQSRPDAKEPR